MRKCNGHLSNKSVLSNFLKEFLLREEFFYLAGRSFQIVGPETLNDLGSNVIVLVLGMYSCPDAADPNCLQPQIDEIVMLWTQPIIHIVQVGSYFNQMILFCFQISRCNIKCKI